MFMEHYDNLGLHLIIKDFDDVLPPTNVFRNALVCSFEESAVSDDFMYRFRLKVMELKLPIVCVINRCKRGSRPTLMLMADSAGILKGNVITMIKNRSGPPNHTVRI